MTDTLSFNQGTGSSLLFTNASGSNLRITDTLSFNQGSGSSVRIATDLKTNTTNVFSTTNATSWNNGALTVDGGIGVGKDIYVSGSATIIGNLTILGSSSIVNISSSTIIIDDNIITLNYWPPALRYSGIEVVDSASANNVSASLLWDGENNYWLTVNQVNTASRIIHGPTASFGNALGTLTATYLPKAFEEDGIVNSSLYEVGTNLVYNGAVFSASALSASNLRVTGTGSITYASGVVVTYVTGSFTTLTISTGSYPGLGLVPVHPTASGMAGQIEIDNNFIYVYTNSSWKRVPLANWTP